MGNIEDNFHNSLFIIVQFRHPDADGKVSFPRSKCERHLGAGPYHTLS